MDNAIIAAANLFHLKVTSKPSVINQRMNKPGPKYTTRSWSIRGVPLIINKNTFIKLDKNLFLDILPIAIGRARGTAKMIVRKNTSSDVRVPSNIA